MPRKSCMDRSLSSLMPPSKLSTNLSLNQRLGLHNKLGKVEEVPDLKLLDPLLWVVELPFVVLHLVHQ